MNKSGVFIILALLFSAMNAMPEVVKLILKAAVFVWAIYKIAGWIADSSES